ncbi:MAG: hypothetical protein GX564_06175, partial [Oligosphaeraceae bacterium]|nr:hypothetical protein [Oligosphaeraceae bacterium]
MVWLLAGLMLSHIIRAESHYESLQSLLAGVPNRLAGSPGNLLLQERAEKIFRDSGLTCGSMEFVAPCFQPGAATLQLAEQGSPWPIHILHPTLTRPGNFPERDFSCELLYLGYGEEAALQALQGQQLQERIAVLEFNSGSAWLSLLRFGFRGFLFLDSPAATMLEGQSKVYATDVGVPRYLLPEPAAGRLRERLRSGPVPGRIVSEPSRWQNQLLRNLWVLLPGSDPVLNRETVLLTAHLDSNAAVPGLAAGASDAGNIQLLLSLLQEFHRRPPARSVLFCLVNAHCAHYLGERILTWSLLSERQHLQEMLDALAANSRLEELFLSHYEQLNLQPPSRQDEELLLSWRNLVDASTGRNISVKEPLVDLARREVNRIKSELLSLQRRQLPEAEHVAESSRLEEQRQRYVKVLTLFNRVGVQHRLSDLTAEEVEVLRGYVQEITASRRTWRRLNQEEISRTSANLQVREVLAERKLLFGLDLQLNWRNHLVGMSSGEHHGSTAWGRRFGLHSSAVARSLQADQAGPISFVDAMTRQGGHPESYYYPLNDDTYKVYQVARKIPAFSLRNVFAANERIFTQGDTVYQIDPARFESLCDYSVNYLRALLDNRGTGSPQIYEQSLKQRPFDWRYNWSVLIKTFRFDEYAAAVLPQLPVPGSMLTLFEPAKEYLPVVSGTVVNAICALTDERAVAVIYGLGPNILLPAAFRYDPDFVQVEQVLDVGENESKLASQISRVRREKTLPLFAACEYPLYARENPALIAVDKITEHDYLLLNGLLNTPPRKFGLAGISSIYTSRVFLPLDGPGAFYLERGEPLKILTRGRLLALNGTTQDPAGRGFASPAAFDTGFFATAVQDMSRLNHARQAALAGTSDDLSAQFLESGDRAIAALEQSRQECRWLDYVQNLYLALGAQSKAYQRLADITNDMLKAVVFYLALLLPFCFFLEKLLFKFKRIELEMLCFAGLFVLTFLVFRQIHPAFRVAQTPEAIFIAFIMGGLGTFVIKILHDRFEGEMHLLFKHDVVTVGTAGVGVSTVGQSAMLIGVNNMKRRRIRTALTTATVVLVTFTMLAFTSISKKLSPTVVQRASTAQYSGLMFHWPGNSCMDEATLRCLRELFTGWGEISVRRWLMPAKVPSGALVFRVESSAGKVASVDAFLGLSPQEDGFIRPLALTAGRFFSSDQAWECVLPEALAAALGIAPDGLSGQYLYFQGQRLAIVGILSDQAFLTLQDLNQRPVLPVKRMVQQADSSGSAGRHFSDEDETGVFYTDLRDLAIIPQGTARLLGAYPYSISLKLSPRRKVWDLVENMLTVTNASKFHIGSLEAFKIGAESRRSLASGVYFIGDGHRTAIGGLAFLIIPLLISGSIILNTMMGSVYERKAEIAIYNAVGLNPTHIGMFFLAEAFVYSVIGSVGGYLIGQFTSIILTRTGLIGDLNLNFSSLSVVYVI